MSWLSLFLFLLMLGIMFYQSIHGMFSALIMAVICVLAGTLALGIHEMLAQDMLADLIGDYSYGVAFIGTFAVTVIILRVVLDKFISRNTLLPGFVDKVGSVFFGVISGLVAAGVIGTGLQMLPFGPAILGFQRLDKDGNPHHSLWLNPDKFAVSLCGYLADYALGAGESETWWAAHPDFLTELAWFRSTESLGSRITATPGSVRATGLWKTTRLCKYNETTGRGAGGQIEPLEGSPPAGKVWLVVSAELSDGAKDSDGQYRFSPTQVRLVGAPREEMPPQQFPLKAVGPFEDNHVLANGRALWGNSTGKFDFVFEVPEPPFVGHFVEFKRAGRGELSNELARGGKSLEERTPSSPPPSSSTVASGGGQPKPGKGEQPRTVPIRPKKTESHIGNELPVAIKRYSGAFLALGGEGRALKSGQLWLYVDRQEGDGKAKGGAGRKPGGDDDEGEEKPVSMDEKTPLDSFVVPADLHLLQLNVEAIQAKTTLGQALNYTRQVLRQYRVIDKNDQTYWPAGQIAECDSGGERIMEIQYFPEDSERQSQIKDFSKIKFQDLQGDYRLVLLFVLPPGTHIAKFDAGGSPIDISDLNLVTPG